MSTPSAYCMTGKFGRPRNVVEFEPEPEPEVKTYGEGRICAHRGCGTILSKYNPNDYCGLHIDEQWSSLCHECTPEGMWVCPRCGKEYSPYFRHWRADPKAKDGFSAVCKRCEKNDS